MCQVYPPKAMLREMALVTELLRVSYSVAYLLRCWLLRLLLLLPLLPLPL